MATIGQAYVQILPTTKGMSANLGNLMQGEGASAGGIFGGELLGKLKKLIVAAGLGKLLMTTITEGAKLEQSLGGIETLFKGSADRVKAYAADSFRTTGLSANQYMENVTGFSASLLSSLGGDTQKAADMSDMAMRDMSDNANKFGSDMGMITQTYQSLARGNYQMLDNLKLGYGGTKTEMERLMRDAEKISGEHYTVGDFGDEVKAIHVIQEQMGITGTTAKEAATTLSGSFASMKAAALDFLGQVTMGGEIQQPVMNLINSTCTFLFNNLIPALGRIIMQIPPALYNLIIQVAPKIVEQFGAWTKALHEGGGKMTQNIIQGIKDHVPDLLRALGDIGLALLKFVAELAVQLVKAGAEMVAALAKGIVGAIGKVLAAFGRLISAGVDNLFSAAGNFIKAGLNIVLGIIKGIGNGIVRIAQAMKNLASNAIKSFAGNWGSLGSGIVSGIIKGITGGAGRLFSALQNLASGALKKAKKVLGIGSPSRVFAKEVGQWIPAGVAVGIDNNMKAVTDAVAAMGATARASIGSDFEVDVNTAYKGMLDSASSIASTDENFANALGNLQSEIVSRMDAFFPSFANARIVMDGKTIGKQMAPRVDLEMGMTAKLAERGV